MIGAILAQSIFDYVKKNLLTYSLCVVFSHPCYLLSGSE